MRNLVTTLQNTSYQDRRPKDERDKVHKDNLHLVIALRRLFSYIRPGSMANHQIGDYADDPKSGLRHR